MDNLLSFLLEYGGCSIQYRIKREIMNMESLNSELLDLQEQILNKPKVKKVIEKRQPDGWIGNELHGARGKGLDSSVCFLLNCGIEKDSQIMRDVVQALLKEKEEVEYRTTFKGGEALDLDGRGGNKAVMAGILADLGEENNLLVQNEIRTSICYLRDSLQYETIDDFTLVNKKGIRYYKTDAHFPGSNHLNLLGATQSWRNDENTELVKKSLAHCMKIMQGNRDSIMFKSNTHFVGPFNFNWNLAYFNIDKIYQDSYALVWWLRSLYRLSKKEVINEVLELKKAYDYLFELVKSHDIFTKQTEASLKRFKDIISIENNWRKQESIYCNVMFYSIIILFNAGYEIKTI